MQEQCSEVSAALQRLFSCLDERLESLHRVPTLADPNAIQNAIKTLPKALPEDGHDVPQTMSFVERTILPAIAPGHAGPRYFGFVTGGSVPAALMGDVLTSIYDQNVQRETISTVVEATALEMVLNLLKLPSEAFPLRTMTTGATASNVLGLACGRDFAVRQALGIPEYSVSENGFSGVTVRILSDRPHASLMKAASIVGIGRSNVFDLFNPATNQLDLLELEKQLSSSTSQEEAKIAFIVSPSFGEVNTGSFTLNMRKLRELCDRYRAWMHVDGAFGAFARVVPELAHFTEGLDLADSIAADAHKWLNVPYDAGLFFSRSLQLQESIFGPSAHSAPPYLAAFPLLDLPPTITNIPSPLNIGIENSRRFRGLPLFSALYSLGRSGYEEMIRRHVSFARGISAWMSSTEEGGGVQWYEVLNASFCEGQTNVHVVPLNVVLFRAREGSALYEPSSSLKLIKTINDTRNLYISPGKGGAARLAVSNWLTGLRTDEEGRSDFEIVVDTLRKVMQTA